MRACGDLAYMYDTYFLVTTSATINIRKTESLGCSVVEMRTRGGTRDRSGLRLQSIRC